MASFAPVPQPTAADVAKFLSLVPTSHAPPPSLRDALAELLAACRFPAALDFLFNPEADPLSILTAPFNRHNAVASSVCISVSEPEPSPALSPHDAAESLFLGNYAFIPAFSIADIQLGFGIRECKATLNGVALEHPCSPTPRTNIFRFIRNDSAHVLIIVQDLDEPLVKIDYMRLISGCMRRRNYLVVTRSGLHDLHRTHSDFEPSQLAPHVAVYRSSVERRPCPICGNQPSSAPCFCVINVPKSRHSLDFSIMGPGMNAHLGDYEGSAVLNFAVKGLNAGSATLGSRMVISKASEEEDLIDRLSRCVIRDELSKSPENPLKDILLRPFQMPQTPSRNQPASELDTSSSSMSSEQSLSVLQTIPVMTPIMNQTSALLEAFCDPKTRTSSIHSDPIQGRKVTLPNPSEIDISQSNASLKLPSMTPSFFTPDGESNKLSWISPEFNNALDATMENPIAPEGLQFSSGFPINEDSALTDLIVQQAVSEYLKENAAVPTNGMQQSDPVPIAPANLIPVPESSKSKAEEERERRADLRRQRNRESAHRSNMKRKHKNDTLKADLKKWHGKVAELRRLEVVLREENLKLRRMLSND